MIAARIDITRLRTLTSGRSPKGRGKKSAFTLTELLVAMAIIAVIAGITAVGVRTLARDAKMASATNTVIAALDTGRGIAIRDNRLTAVVFRPRVEGNRQYVEIVTAQWTGQSQRVLQVNFPDGQSQHVIERFVPVPGIAVRRLPVGIKVAGPNYGDRAPNADFIWQTQSHFAVVGESPGVVLGVMFAGDGTVVTRNSATDSHGLFVDFNNDNIQQMGSALIPGGILNFENPPATLPQVSSDDYPQLFWHHPVTAAPAGVEKEPLISLVPFIAVFDDERCRAEYDTSEWTDPDQRRDDYTQYITNHADRIHFNRYTGVVMR